MGVGWGGGGAGVGSGGGVVDGNGMIARTFFLFFMPKVASPTVSFFFLDALNALLAFFFLALAPPEPGFDFFLPAGGMMRSVRLVYFLRGLKTFVAAPSRLFFTIPWIFWYTILPPLFSNVQFQTNRTDVQVYLAGSE